MTTYINEIRSLLAATDFAPVTRKPKKVKAQVKLLTPEDRQAVERNSYPERIGWRPLRADMRGI